MQPVDATSGARSLTTVRAAVPSTQTARTDSVVEQIPIVEPRPHYPVSASVAEIMAHITELIKEQQTASQEALHQKNLDEARAEMERLFEAVRGQSDNTINGKKADDGGVVRADVGQITEIDDQALKVPGTDDNTVTSLDNSNDGKNAQGISAHRAKGINKNDAGSADVNRTSATKDGDLPSLPSDAKNGVKKGSNVKTDKTYQANLSEQKDNMSTIPNRAGSFDQQNTVENSNAEVSIGKDDI